MRQCLLFILKKRVALGAWVVIYSLFLELNSISKLEDMAKIKVIKKKIKRKKFWFIFQLSFICSPSDYSL